MPGEHSSASTKTTALWVTLNLSTPDPVHGPKKEAVRGGREPEYSRLRRDAEVAYDPQNPMVEHMRIAPVSGVVHSHERDAGVGIPVEVRVRRQQAPNHQSGQRGEQGKHERCR